MNDYPALKPLVRAAMRLGCPSLAVFGSATTLPVDAAHDVDVHVVATVVTVETFGDLVAAGEDAARLLAGGRPCRLETRHGPFKPAPEDGVTQLHLIVDDVASFAAAPFMLRLQRAATSVALVGPVLLPELDGTPGRSSAREELGRWRDALAHGEIPYRKWVFTPEPRLIDARTPVTTGWERLCLEKAAKTAELLYRQPVDPAG
jgi:hypothetical protein